MDILLFNLASLLLAAVAIAFGIEWLSLWMSKQETSKEIVTGREKTQGR